jgi:hypothetical protein
MRYVALLFIASGCFSVSSAEIEKCINLCEDNSGLSRIVYGEFNTGYEYGRCFCNNGLSMELPELTGEFR